MAVPLGLSHVSAIYPIKKIPKQDFRPQARQESPAAAPDCAAFSAQGARSAGR